MRGGARKGAGRKKGGRNRKSREIADRAATEGITPLEVMLENMRFFHTKAAEHAGRLAEADPETAVETLKIIMGARQSAQEAAKDAAPYMHPRLAAIEHSGEDGGPVQVEIVERRIVRAHADHRNA